MNEYSPLLIKHPPPIATVIPKNPRISLPKLKGLPKPGKLLRTRVNNIDYSAYKLNFLAHVIRNIDFLDAIYYANISEKKAKEPILKGLK